MNFRWNPYPTARGAILRRRSLHRLGPRDENDFPLVHGRHYVWDKDDELWVYHPRLNYHGCGTNRTHEYLDAEFDLAWASIRKVQVSHGWQRFGALCSAKRRSLWVRFVHQYDQSTGRLPVVALEVCGGREGDDKFWRFEASDERFQDIQEMLSCGVWYGEY